MKKINILSTLTCLCAIVLLQSCELFGLPIQTEYPFEASIKDPRIFKSAYQFVEDRKSIDMFLMYTALTSTGLKEEYEKADRTFIILNDAAFTGYMTDKKFNSLVLEDLRPGQIDTLSLYLKSMIAFGKHTSLSLPAAPLELETVYKDATHRLFLNRRVQKPDNANKYQLYVNDFPGTKRWALVRTTNIEATNGIIHVVSNYPEYQAP